jgi:hypothetical protein
MVETDPFRMNRPWKAVLLRPTHPSQSDAAAAGRTAENVPWECCQSHHEHAKCIVPSPPNPVSDKLISV